MSKIHELVNNEKTILVFDVDGVLAKLEFGEYTHYEMSDEKWAKAIENNKIFYTEDFSFKFFKDFLKCKNMSNIFVITNVYNDKEANQKKDFVYNNYGIKKENFYATKENKEKLNALYDIKKRLNITLEENIVMIDDSVDVLNNIMNNSKFSTMHISSFLDVVIK